MLAAIGLVSFQFSVLQRKLPDFHAFLTPQNIVWLFLALALAKIVHELAHALTCIHVGGQCHEIGLLLLVFTPCLYCDVRTPGRFRASGGGSPCRRQASSSKPAWRRRPRFWWFSACRCLPYALPSRHARMFGEHVAVERQSALAYHGYYVLADWLEVPNLGQQSQALLNRLMARFFLGIAKPEDRSLPQRRRGLLGGLCRGFGPLPLADRAGHPLVLLSRGQARTARRSSPWDWHSW